MRIRFTRSGGFGGVVLSREMESGSLPPDVAAELRELVERAGFFALPAELRSDPRARDRFVYRVAVEDEGRAHEVRVEEGAASPELARLLRRLAELATKPQG